MHYATVTGILGVSMMSSAAFFRCGSRCPGSAAAPGLAAQIRLAVDLDGAVRAGRELDGRFPWLDALVEIIPEFKTGDREIDAVSDHGLAVDPAVIFILVDHR